MITRLGIEDLEARYRRSRGDREECLRILEELERREANRIANGLHPFTRNQELATTIRTRLGVVNDARQECVVATPCEPKPWYRRGGVILSIASLVTVGVVQGIFHAIGFHLWEPILVAMRSIVGKFVGY